MRAALVEIEVRIALVVVVKAHVDTQHVAVVVVAAGVGTSVAVYAGLQSLGVYVVGHGFETVGKTCGVDKQFSRLGVTSAKESVVDIDMVEAHILQSFVHHGIGLAAYQFVADIDAVGVP